MILTLFLLLNTTVQAAEESFQIFPLRPGDSVSEVLYHEFAVGTPESSNRLYGQKGMVKDVFKMNNMPPEQANKLRSGFKLKLPGNLTPVGKMVNPPLASTPVMALEETPEVKNIQAAPTMEEEPIPQDLASAVITEKEEEIPPKEWNWLPPHFSFFGGTYLTNKADTEKAGAKIGLSRNLQPIGGVEFLMRWGKPDYYFSAVTRAFFTKNADSNPSIPTEFWAGERLAYPGLKLWKITPYFDLNYERFYVNQPGAGALKLTKIQGFWGGLGLRLPLNFGANEFRLFFSYLQALGVKATGNALDNDLTGYQLHYWMRYNRTGPLFVELHGQRHNAHDSVIDVSSSKIYTLAGFEF